MPNTNQVRWLPNQGWDSRIHIAANGDLVNVFVVVTESYVVLVDTLLNTTTANALVEYAKPYLTERQLLVVNSHADWDHAWGNQLFAGPHALYPAPIIAHNKGSIRFHTEESRDDLQEMQSAEPEIFGDVVLTKPTLTFSHHLIIDGGDLALHLFPTPGHRPDHIAIYIPQIRTLLPGDAAEFPFPFADDAASLPTMRASLAALAELYADTVLYCHAPPTIGPQLIRDNIAYFDALEAACRTALDRGLDPTQFADQELAAALHCDFAAVTPNAIPWTDLPDEFRVEGHAEQLRLMLTWLTHGEEMHSEERIEE